MTADEAWKDIEFEVALDSGSVVHVCAPEDIPGYHVGESAGSRRRQEFLMGDGGTIPNLDGTELARFERKNGGLYVAKLTLRNPAGFGGQE